MKWQDQWFSVFGKEGGLFVKTTLNSILGLIIASIFIIGSIKILSLFVKGKLLDEEAQIVNRKTIKKTIVGFSLGLLSVTLIIIIINVIPKPANKLSSTSWLDAFGSEKGGVTKSFNWAMAGVMALGVISYLVLTPSTILKYILGDEEQKQMHLKKIKGMTIYLIIVVMIPMLLMIILNIIPAPHML